jgi:hypothetical protein
VFVFAAAAYVALHRAYAPSPTAVATQQPAADFERAIAQHAHDVRVHGGGVVAAVLRDDDTGERHQRFIVRLPTGETILITHNIDIAPRVEDLRVGDSVEFSGEYVWNDKGGVVHWTHHDPSGHHPSGFLLVRGREYR